MATGELAGIRMLSPPPSSSSTLFVGVLLLLGAVARDACALTRRDFPEGFVFGAGTSAFQVEGAAAEDGRKPSIWDTVTHQGYSPDGCTADVSADQYHRYKEDVKLLYEMGLDAYRFSISWPRLVPDGRGEINPKGLEYYENLIDELILHGIQPHVTIYHFDLPQVLQDEYGGLLSPRFIEDYTAYAEVCFKNFGDRVKHWATMNEPNVEPIGGYDTGNLPPRRCSYPFGTNCTGGDSSTEPYIVAHHLLLAHASAVSLYRQKYQAIQGGQIGLTLVGWWHEPATDTPQDAAAAMRVYASLGVWRLPSGDAESRGARLPSLTAFESEKVRGSFDFIGINHYSVVRVQSSRANGQKLQDYFVDAGVQNPATRGFDKAHFQSLSWALGKVLDHLKLKYGNPPVMIHENGYGDFPENPSRIDYDDDFRSEFFQSYLEVLHMSIRNGSDARGYFVWSLLDAFEFLFGYSARFGLCGVDFAAAGRARYVRNSALWYSGFLRGGGQQLRPPAQPEKSYVAS